MGNGYLPLVIKDCRVWAIVFQKRFVRSPHLEPCAAGASWPTTSFRFISGTCAETSLDLFLFAVLISSPFHSIFSFPLLNVLVLASRSLVQPFRVFDFFSFAVFPLSSLDFSPSECFQLCFPRVQTSILWMMTVQCATTNPSISQPTVGILTRYNSTQRARRSD